MAQQLINIGTTANDGTGDPLRTAFDKCNDNFTELYGSGGGGGIGGSTGATDNAILRADGTGGSTLQTSGITIADGTTGTLSGTNSGDQNLFATIAVAGQSDVVADSTTDTLTLVAGSNVTITTDATTDTITISASGGGGGGGAPVGAEYLVGAADGTLTAERVVGSSTSISANLSTAGAATFERAALTGDVTASANSNSTTIAAGVVNTTKLGGDITTAGKALLDDADAAAQRTTLGLGTLATQSGTFSGTSSGINTGDQTITLTGDVTGSGTGSFAATISAGAVGTSKLGGDITTAGKALLDDADAAAQRTTLGLGTLATQSGTFSGTSSGTNTGDVTLASPNRYLSLASQQITAGLVDLASHVTGDLPFANLTQATAASVLVGRGSASGAGDFQEISLGSGLSMSGTTLSVSAGGGNVSSSGTPTSGQTAEWASSSTITGVSTTGTGNYVKATSPTLTTPTLGVASATSINKVAITAPAVSSTLTIADGKTLTASNTLTFTGTDSSSVAFGAGGTVAYTGGTLAQFSSTTSSQLAGVISDETGSGALVFATSPTLVTPVLGTPSSGTLTNCTGLPVAGTTFAATSRIHGRATAGAGAGEELTLSQVLDLVGSAAQGDILYRGASSWTRLAAGTSGQYLKTQGAAADPVWATVSASGGGSTNVWIPAAQWIPRTTTGCGINSLEASTNKINYDVLEFDPSTAEYAQVAIVMPSNWNAGTVTAKFHWTAASGSGSVVWGLSGRAYADNNALDQATGTAQTVTDTLLTAAYEHITSATSAITLAGSPAAGQMVIFQLYRDATNGSDTLGSDAQFFGVEITYTSV